MNKSDYRQIKYCLNLLNLNLLHMFGCLVLPLLCSLGIFCFYAKNYKSLDLVISSMKSYKDQFAPSRLMSQSSSWVGFESLGGQTCQQCSKWCVQNPNAHKLLVAISVWKLLFVATIPLWELLSFPRHLPQLQKCLCDVTLVPPPLPSIIYKHGLHVTRQVLGERSGIPPLSESRPGPVESRGSATFPSNGIKP